MQPSQEIIDISSLYTKYNGVNKFSGGNHVRSIGIGLKSINGEITDLPAVVFFVKEKKQLKDLDPNKIIPKKVLINGTEYLTDVVQNSRKNYTVNSLGCYGTNLDSYASSHRVKFRWYPPIPEYGIPSSGNPVQGGISINQSEGGTGTLGAVVIDNVNGKLCALSNAHVLVKDSFLASEKNILGPLGYPLKISNIRNKGVSQPGEAINGSSPSFNQNTGIGYVKRYGPMYFWHWNNQGQFVYHNYIDAAICSLKKNTQEVTTQASGQSPSPGKNPFVVWQDSTKQFNMTFSDGISSPTEYPFASEAEVAALTIGTRVWKSGRTTGFVGKDECQLEIIGLNEQIEVYGYNFSQFVTTSIFSDCLKFAYKLVGTETIPRPGAILGGDSGSVLIADINGTKKIIGLNFAGGYYSDNAGNGSVGYACKIHHVSNELNINSTSTLNMFEESNISNPYYDNYYDDKNAWKFRIEPGLSSFKQISAGLDQTYYQCGLYK